MAGKFMYAGKFFKVETIDFESVKVSYDENNALIVRTVHDDPEKFGNYHIYDVDDDIFGIGFADTPSEAIAHACNQILKDLERKSGFKSYEESAKDLTEWVNSNTK